MARHEMAKQVYGTASMISKVTPFVHSCHPTYLTSYQTVHPKHQNILKAIRVETKMGKLSSRQTNETPHCEISILTDISVRCNRICNTASTLIGLIHIPAPQRAPHTRLRWIFVVPRSHKREMGPETRYPCHIAKTTRSACCIVWMQQDCSGLSLGALCLVFRSV